MAKWTPDKINGYRNKEDEEERKVIQQPKQERQTWEEYLGATPKPKYDFGATKPVAPPPSKPIQPNANVTNTLNQMYAEKKEQEKNKFKPIEAIKRFDEKATNFINQSKVGRGFLGTADAVANALGKNALERGVESIRGNKYSKDEWQQEQDQRRRKLLGMGVDEQYTFSDNVAEMVGNVTGQLTGMLTGTKALGVGAGIGSRIAGNAAVAGTQGAARSYGEGNTGKDVVKDAARDALFYAAGTAGSEVVGNALGTGATKLGQYGREALKGLSFDAAGYAATLPTYQMTGDQMPAGKEIATDMITGALFDFIPNAVEVSRMDLPMLKRVKAESKVLTPEINNQIERRIYELEEGYSIDTPFKQLGTSENFTRGKINRETETPDVIYQGYNNRPEIDEVHNASVELPQTTANKSFDYTDTINQVNPYNQTQAKYGANTDQYGDKGNKAYNYFKQDAPYPEVYDTYFEMMYGAGVNNIPYDRLPRTEFDKVFPEYMKQSFYNAGQNDRGLPYKSDKKEVLKVVKEPTPVELPKTKEAIKYQIEEKEILGERQKEVYEYLHSDKQGKKAKEYYLSPELNGVDELKRVMGTNEKLIKFTDDKGAAKLDVLQMEMSNQFPEVREMGLEEFGTFLVDTVKKYKGDVKDIKAMKQGIKEKREKVKTLESNPVVIKAREAIENNLLTKYGDSLTEFASSHTEAQTKEHIRQNIINEWSDVNDDTDNKQQRDVIYEYITDLRGQKSMVDNVYQNIKQAKELPKAETSNPDIGEAKGERNYKFKRTGTTKIDDYTNQKVISQLDDYKLEEGRYYKVKTGEKSSIEIVVTKVDGDNIEFQTKNSMPVSKWRTIPRGRENYQVITKSGEVEPITDKSIIKQLNQQELKEGDIVDISNKGYEGKIAIVDIKDGKVTFRTESNTKTLEAWKEAITDYDLKYDDMYRAYVNESWDPERRAKDTIKDYKKHMNSVYEKYSAMADTPEKKELLLSELETYKTKYLQKFNAYMSAKSQTASTAITGRDGFNYTRNNKKMATEDRRRSEFLEWQEKALKSIEKKLKPKADVKSKLKDEVMTTVATLKSIKDGNYHGDKSLFVKSLQGKLIRSANNGNIEEVKEALGLVKQLQEEYGVTVFAKNNSVWKVADQAKERIEVKQEATKQAINETGLPPYTVKQDKDTRDNSDIWVLKFDERMSKEEFNEYNSTMKEFGGYYSRYKKGFIFKEEPSFSTLKEANLPDADGYSTYDNFSSTQTGPKLAAATGEYKGKAKKGSEIFAEFGEKLGMSIRNNKRLRGALGQHSYKTGLTDIKKANDIPVLAHETGHFLDNIFKFRDITDKAIRAELIELGKATSKKKDSPAKKQREGIAEFMRLFMTEDVKAKELAPNFYKYFEGAIPKDTMKVLKELQKDIWQLSNLSPGERFKKTISFRTDYMGMNKVKKDVKKVKNFDVGMKFKEIYTGVFDKTYPLEWAAREMGGKEAGLNMRDKLGVSRGVEEMSLYNLEYAQTDFYGKEIGPSFKDITEPIHKDEKTRQDFWTYAAAKRALDYFERGLEMTDDLATVKGAIAEFETPEFKKVFDDIQKYNENNLELLVECGMLSRDQVKAMKEVNPNYIPLNRVQEAFESLGGKGGSKGVKRLKGGGQDIRDPEENIIMNTFSYRKLAQEKMLWKDLADMADTNTNVGDIMVAASQKYKAFDMDKKQIEKAVGKVLEEMGFESDGLDVDFYSKMFIPDLQAGPNQVVIQRDGKSKVYDVNPFLYSIINNQSIRIPNSIKTVIQTLGKIAQVSKTGIIFNPRYIAYNLSRDTFSSLTNSRSGLNPLDIGLGIVEAFKHGDSYKAAMKTGAFTGYFNTSDRKYAQEQIDHIMKEQSFTKRALGKITHPFETIGDFIEPGELAARLPEYKKTIIKEYRKRYNSKESSKVIFNRVVNNPREYQSIIARATFNARDLTLDFNKGGQWVQELGLNKMNNFFNSQVQGVGKTMRTFTNKEEGTRAALKGLAYITLPSLGMWAYAQKEDREMYEELPSYRKDGFMNVPMGNGMFFPIPLPPEYSAVFSALPRRMIEKEMMDNPKAFDGYAESLIDTFFGMDFIPTAFKPMYEVATNKNFTGSPILSQGDLSNPPELQYNRYTSDLAMRISEIANGISEVSPDFMSDWFEVLKSPKKVDHLLKGYTGTLGNMLIQGNVVEGIKDSFVSDARKSPQSMNYYYDYKEQIGYDRRRYKASGTEPIGYSEELRLAFNSYDKQILDLNDIVNEMRDNKVSEDEIQVYTDKRLELMKEANKLVEDFKRTGRIDLSGASEQVKFSHSKSMLNNEKSEAGDKWNKDSNKGKLLTKLNSIQSEISKIEKAIEKGTVSEKEGKSKINELYKQGNELYNKVNK